MWYRHEAHNATTGDVAGLNATVRGKRVVIRMQTAVAHLGIDSMWGTHLLRIAIDSEGALCDVWPL